MLRVLCAFFGGADKRAFHVNAEKVCAFFAAGCFLPVFLPGSGIVQDMQQLFVRQRHCGRADAGNALGCFVFCDYRNGFHCTVAYVRTGAAVKMQVDQARDGIASFGVQNVFFLCLCGKHAVFDMDVAVCKRLVFCVYFCMFNDHTNPPFFQALSSRLPVPGVYGDVGCLLSVCPVPRSWNTGYPKSAGSGTGGR